MSDVNNFLAHYGVLGMKWGVRKDDRGPSKSRQIKDDRKLAKDELKQIDAEFKIVKAKYKATRGQPRAVRDAAWDEVRKVDDAWCEAYFRATKRTTGENLLNIGGPLVIGASMILGGKYLENNPTLFMDIAKSAQAKKGAAQAAKLFADKKGLTSYKTLALVYDAATGRWR